MDLVVGDIQPIKLGAGSISYHRYDYVRTTDVASATIFGLVVVACFKVDGEERRVTFPLANLVEHVAK